MVVAYHDYRLHVFGSGALPQGKLEAAIASADSLSNAVRALASAYYSAGYPAAQLTYALANRDLYILVTLGRLAAVRGPRYLTKYFTDIHSDEPLTSSALERRRTLASLHADRAGENATPLLVRRGPGPTSPNVAPGYDDDDYLLDLKPDQSGPKQTAVRAEVSNPGNRYVGRHFIDLDVKQNTGWGDEFHFLWRHSLTFLNHSNNGSNYAEYDLAWNRVTPYGVLGLAIMDTRYRIELENLPLTGMLTSGEADWFGVLAADFFSRWTLQARLGRTDKRLDAPAPSGPVQHELYNWSELGSQYSIVHPLGQQRLNLDAGITLGAGLSPDERAVATDFRYFVWRPALHAQLQASASVTVALDASAQLTHDTVPEQQQWVLGGLNNGGAYLPGVATGDAGEIVRGSLAYAAIPLGEHFRLTPKIFAEYGIAELKHPSPGQNQGKPAIADAGVDLTLGAFEWLELGLAYAEGFYDHDLTSDELQASRARLFFHVRGTFSF